MSGQKSTASTPQQLATVQVQTSSAGNCIPIVWGTARIACNLVGYYDFYAIPQYSQASSGKGGSKRTVTSYSYSASMLLALCEGPVADIPRCWQGKDQVAMTSSTQATAAGRGWLATMVAALTQVPWAKFMGATGQSPWSYLQSKHPDQALGYSNTAYIGAPNMDLGSSASLPNNNFEVVSSFTVPGSPDANPKDVLVDFLTNPLYGVPGWDSSRIGDLTQYSNYCLANNLLVSPALDSQVTASQFVQDLADATNSLVVWSEGKLKMVPRGDATATANGATYTPNTTPIYSLTDDDFLTDGGNQPVRLIRSRPADAYNRFPVEFLDRSNSYNVDVVEARDTGSIYLYGHRKASPKQLHMICNATTAMQVAQIEMQRQLYVRNTYQFDLGWNYALLEEGDIVELTDAKLGLQADPVMIVEVEENSDGMLTFTAEEWPFGVNSQVLYPTQGRDGYVPQLNAPAAACAAPVLMDAPGCMTDTGFELWVAIAGAGIEWGGAEVWVSSDDATYKYAGTIDGPARYGSLTSVLINRNDPDTIDALAVDLSISGGQLSGGTQADADAYHTLCFVDGELVSFETATLTAANQYNLSYLRRGIYNSPIGAHSAGSAFVRLDEAIFKYAYNPGLVGQTIYLKFLSFNRTGGGKQQLSDVTSVSHVLQGSITRPDAPTSVTATGQPHGILLAWTGTDADSANPDASFEIRSGAAWGTSTLVTKVTASSYLLGVQSVGTYSYQIKAIDKSGNYSPTAASVTFTVAPPAQVSPSATITGSDCILSWAVPAATFVIDHYEIRTGATWDMGTPLTTIKGTSLKTPATWSSNQTFWVAAIDAAGNVGTPGGVTAGINAPVAPQVAAALNGDTATFSWSDATASLPIDHYEMRQGGTSWATATSIATIKGNSLQLKPNWSGSQTFWVAATDSAGNVGAAGSFSLTITAPKAAQVSQQVIDNYVLLSWTDATASLPITGYMVSKGATYATSTPIGKLNGRFTTIFESASGNYTYWIVGIDSAGNQGTPASCTATVNQPPDYVLYYNWNSEFVGGPANALNGADMGNGLQLSTDGHTVTVANGNGGYFSIRAKTGYSSGKWYWEVTVPGGSQQEYRLTMGIANSAAPLTDYFGNGTNGYGYYSEDGQMWYGSPNTGHAYGATFHKGDVIGVALDMDNGILTFYKNGQSQGTAVSGLTGTWYPALALMTQGDQLTVNFGDSPFMFEPPDGYVGRVAMINENGHLLAPIDRSATIQTHFDNHTWTSPQDQVNAGFPIAGEPAPASATYTETIDYGSTLPATNIVVTPTTQAIAGNPGISCKISVRLNATDAWTDYPNTWQVYVANFRYVKVVLTVTSSAGADLLSIQGINIRMNVKLRNDAGTGTASASDASGTQVNFNYRFIDVSSITVSPSVGSTAAFATYAFQDVPNPAGFQVYLWDKNGNRLSGGFSWSAKGV